MRSDGDRQSGNFIPEAAFPPLQGHQLPSTRGCDDASSMRSGGLGRLGSPKQDTKVVHLSHYDSRMLLQNDPIGLQPALYSDN